MGTGRSQGKCMSSMSTCSHVHYTQIRCEKAQTLRNSKANAYIPAIPTHPKNSLIPSFIHQSVWPPLLHWFSRVTLQSSRGMPVWSCSNTVRPPPIRLSYHNSEQFILRYWLVDLCSILIHKNELELQGPRIANPWPSEKDKPRKSALSPPRCSEGYEGWARAL